MKIFAHSLSLGNQITAAVAFLPAVIALLVVCWLPSYLTRTSKASYEDRAEASVMLLAHNLQPALEFDDLRFQRKNLRALEADPEAVSAIVVGDTGQIQTSWSRTDHTAVVRSPGWNELELVVSQPIHSPSVKSRLIVHYRADMLAELHQQTVATTTATAVAVFVGGLAFSLLLGRLLTRRLKKIATASDAIKLGRFTEARTMLLADAQLGNQRYCRDEVLHLSARVHEMASGLERYDRALRDHHRTLESRIDQQTQELRDALAEAHLASQTKSRFLATVSHELRTPMNGVLGAAQLLADGTLRQDQSELVDIMVRSSETLLALLDQVLDVSKIEAGHMTLDRTDFHLGEVLGDCVNLFRATAQTKGIRLAMHVNVGGWMQVYGDSHRIRQIVANLVGNAVKFTDTGTVTVRCINEGPVEQEGYTIRIEVEDTGPGIEPDAVDRIFEAFTQADSSTTRKFGGTGLGLTICKQLVELMDGEIGVRSQVGRGTTFWIRLNLLAASRPAQVAPTKDLTTFVALKVLVVEDNQVNLTIAQRMLTRLGHQSHAARDGVQALRAVEQQHFDVVLMDCQMPEMDGYEASRRIRAMKSATRHTPIVALTANAFEEDHQRCLEAGMDDFLTKPLRLSALQLALLHAVESSRQARHA
ncbi:MAG: signal transduction histidine kinase/ActR/RegA family two-component response regulator [Kiritimatiellia bacterium]|jgi:signal transduction histidine kinase/ActR/RegA family two-component response regulator